MSLRLSCFRLPRVPNATAALVIALPVIFTGCITYEIQPNTPEQPEVVRVAEQVLRERYYQTIVYKTSGHLVAYSPVVFEGVERVRKKVDVHIRYENTGHFMPEVHVRKYYDMNTEPPLETGDFSSPYEATGHPFARENWRAVHFDQAEEDLIRREILKRLQIQADMPPVQA